ncbi:MAG: DUF3382 domain-containing protein, partial [Mesorhizobium sp.]|nr:DUF3382 domain-containing protein [Mesorhizobium sp.]
MTASDRPAQDTVMTTALKEAGYAGLITFGLFFLIVGLKTDQNIHNELILVQRWGLLAILVLIAAAGRFLMAAYVRPQMARRASARAAAKPAAV